MPHKRGPWAPRCVDVRFEAPSSGGGLRITPRKRVQVPWCKYLRLVWKAILPLFYMCLYTFSHIQSSNWIQSSIGSWCCYGTLILRQPFFAEFWNIFLSPPCVSAMIRVSAKWSTFPKVGLVKRSIHNQIVFHCILAAQTGFWAFLKINVCH